jgi:nitrogen fixation/metabolism regulation signal transduction histidine kinase
LPLIIFLTIPLVLLVFLAISTINLIRDFIAQRTGSKFQTRLFVYFIITVMLAAVPVTVITTQTLYELVQFWRSIELAEALESAQRFALETYSHELRACEDLIRRRADQIDALMAALGDTSGGADASAKGASAEWAAVGEAPGEEALREIGGSLRAVQDFRRQAGAAWSGTAFLGEAARELGGPPAMQPGFVSREMPRDTDLIRYVAALPPGPDGQEGLRVISYHLGDGFDRAVEVIVNEKARFETIGDLSIQLRPLLIFYYGVFFLPTLLMTVIIAVSLSRRVTQPLVELAEATRRVAEGDFSIQILTRPGDELALLIRSFNAMVRDLEKTRGALVRAEKISIWQTMAQQLAHEIKNPLTPIKLSAERVLRRWQNSPEGVGEILESSMLAILQEVEGLSTLLTEFRTLSRPMEPSQSWTRLKETVEELIVPYKSSYPALQFNLEHIPFEAAVKIDKRHFAQILTNLIINGIDAMDGQGLLEIRTDLVKKRESRYCRLSIRDTGKGISRADKDRVFTPYYTTKASGTGLGLPIVERIVNDHGGSIWFNSAEGAGTTFFIDFPLEESPGGGERLRNDQGTDYR